MLVVLMMCGLSISVFQYMESIKTEIVNAAQTIPNPGHSWSSMETGPDSVQVNGKTITNLATPVASTDAANKAYVDSVSGGGTYSACYILYSTSSSTACASGYTSIAHFYGGVGATAWTVDNPNGSTNAQGFVMTIGGSSRVVRFSFCHNSWSTATCYDNLTWARINTYSGTYATNVVYPAISIDTLLDYSGVVSSTAQTYAFCCK